MHCLYARETLEIDTEVLFKAGLVYTLVKAAFEELRRLWQRFPADFILGIKTLCTENADVKKHFMKEENSV